jgi:hypothetical protein
MINSLKMKSKALSLTLIIGFLVVSYNSYSQTQTDSIAAKQIDTIIPKVEKKLKFGSGYIQFLTHIELGKYSGNYKH